MAIAAGAVVIGAAAEAAPSPASARTATPTTAPVAGALAWPSTPDRTSTALQRAFTAAAAEFHVPVDVLLAVSYEETLWESHGGRPSVTGNYNVMGLTEVSDADLTAPSSQSTRDLTGSGAAHAPQPSARALAERASVDTASPAMHTLQTAAALAGVSANLLKTDMTQSVRGGAALLASYESRLRPQAAAPGGVPTDAAAWWPAVVAYAQAETPVAGQQFAARAYTLIQQGASRVTDDNQAVSLTAAPSVAPPELAAAQASVASTDGGDGTSVAECPGGLACAVSPAAYQQNGTQDGNYAKANRPTDGDQVDYLVIHDTEGSAAGTVASYQDPTAYSSAHYVVGRDGSVTQLVPTADVAWHSGNQTVNAHSVGIEAEGYALPQGSWYPEAEYESTAALVKYLAAKFEIPLDREHILGADDVPEAAPASLATSTSAPAASGATPSTASTASAPATPAAAAPSSPSASASAADDAADLPADPGPYWDWSRLLALVGAPLGGTHARPVVGGLVTLAPPYSLATQPAVTGCGGDGQACPSHPANFVYLRQAPSADAPLVGQGTTAASDGTDKAAYGQTFVVADVSGDWVALWYDGQEAWLQDPNWSDTLVPDPTTSADLMLVAPAGDRPIPVYGRAFPETSAYPSQLGALAASASQQLVPLADTISPGQAYLAGSEVSGDFNAATYGCGGAVGCRVVIGTTQYYPIQFDHRLAFVMASDVQQIAPAR
ncbi:N-acetylmuramoyl-L-alanine amidase [Streptacidiphilus fuscans]|uniref:N-acetylmuramoyl-L-alanine amidase n=1 Tax=Streptacidiphilus fuscans TaxID=2789292 RepID=A0A931AYX5_9ACTN|nr:peptidoglycan recognition family protein [Streptacidiphilus fuscans]MBF9067994.1 N-acetylmuramoyl-L-alanine amidase [Streptacidiphilus fuscans]